MKRHLTLISVLIICLAVTSCTDNSTKDYNSKEWIEPGEYYIEMGLDAQKAATKGVVENNDDFDNEYTPDYIYLHSTTDDNLAVKFPVYECDECPTNGKAIRYRICKFDDGIVKITPIDSDGNYVQDEMKEINEEETFYFSSWSTNDWQLEKEQIDERQEINDPSQTYNFFYRKNNVNQEIYRSKNNFTISTLRDNNDLVLVRACAGFSLVGFFYDESTLTEDPYDETGESYVTNLGADDFKTIMGSPYSEWYIKIYIGDAQFTNSYDLAEQKSTGTETGYYSSGDNKVFEEGQLTGQEFLPLRLRKYGDKSLTHNGIGYFTYKGNNLFTPIAESDQKLNIYILIKHWNSNDDPHATADHPSEEWLNSDIGALQTKVNESISLSPVNNIFYTAGLLMDIHQFKAAWDASGGDNWQEGTSTVSTKSPSGATVREFTLKDAKVICDVY